MFRLNAHQTLGGYGEWPKGSLGKTKSQNKEKLARQAKTPNKKPCPRP